MTKVIASDHLIGPGSVGESQREGHKASLPVEQSAGRRVSIRAGATNGWMQNWHSSNPGRQNNNNKNNTRRLRAVRRPEAADEAEPTVSELFQAYYDCRRTKRNTASALVFEERLERNLMELYRELISGEYSPGPSTCFVVTHPKVREIWAASFRDRIVHHLLCNRIAHRFRRGFIHDSYACIPGRGLHFAVGRVESMARRVTQSHTRQAYVLKMDVANFFVSIDKQILDAILMRKITAPWWRDLCRKVLHNNPAVGAHVQSRPELLRQVPQHKSLFRSGGNGLPIGNLSSQFFANVYLNEMDQHAKHKLGLRYWGRYVDDIVAMHADHHVLLDARRRVSEFLGSRLRLRLHPNKTYINLIERGFDAFGFVIRPHARYLRRSTVRHAFAKVRRLRGRSAAEVQPVMNSYFGLMAHADAWRQQKQLRSELRAAGYRVRRRHGRFVMRGAA